MDIYIYPTPSSWFLHHTNSLHPSPYPIPSSSFPHHLFITHNHLLLITTTTSNDNKITHPNHAIELNKTSKNNRLYNAIIPYNRRTNIHHWLWGILAIFQEHQPRNRRRIIHPRLNHILYRWLLLSLYLTWIHPYFTPAKHRSISRILHNVWQSPLHHRFCLLSTRNSSHSRREYLYIRKYIPIHATDILHMGGYIA